MVSGGIVPESGNERDKLEIPKLTISKSDNLEKTHRIADLARASALLQKNHSLLWDFFIFNKETLYDKLSALGK